MFVISCSATYFLFNHPFVFINSTSDPKLSAIILLFVYISFVTDSVVYVNLLLFSVFIILTIESAVNNPDDFSST